MSVKFSQTLETESKSPIYQAKRISILENLQLEFEVKAILEDWPAPNALYGPLLTPDSMIFRHSAHAHSDESDWLRIRNEFSAHTRKIGPSQNSRFLVVIKRSEAFGKRMPPYFSCNEAMTLSDCPE